MVPIATRYFRSPDRSRDTSPFMPPNIYCSRPVAASNTHTTRACKHDIECVKAEDLVLLVVWPSDEAVIFTNDLDLRVCIWK